MVVYSPIASGEFHDSCLTFSSLFVDSVLCEAIAVSVFVSSGCVEEHDNRILSWCADSALPLAAKFIVQSFPLVLLALFKTYIV